jgi:hypothetical protein
MTASPVLKASDGFSRSSAPGESPAFEATEGHEGTEELKETQGHQATKPYSGSRQFSATNMFTERDRPSGGHRPLISLGGYLFFVFFYGNPE